MTEIIFATGNAGKMKEIRMIMIIHKFTIIIFQLFQT